MWKMSKYRYPWKNFDLVSGTKDLTFQNIEGPKPTY